MRDCGRLNGGGGGISLFGDGSLQFGKQRGEDIRDPGGGIDRWARGMGDRQMLMWDMGGGGFLVQHNTSISHLSSGKYQFSPPDVWKRKVCVTAIKAQLLIH
jgi:hypothetical protein